jgi:hypothetical protein
VTGEACRRVPLAVPDGEGVIVDLPHVLERDEQNGPGPSVLKNIDRRESCA